MFVRSACSSPFRSAAAALDSLDAVAESADSASRLSPNAAAGAEGEFAGAPEGWMAGLASICCLSDCSSSWGNDAGAERGRGSRGEAECWE